MQTRNEYKTIFDKIQLSLGNRLFTYLEFSLKTNTGSDEPSICSRYMQKEADAQNILVKVKAKLPTACLGKKGNGSACICIPDVDSLAAELDFGISALDYVKPIVMPRYVRDEAPKYTRFEDSCSSEMSPTSNEASSRSSEDPFESDSDRASTSRP